MDIINRAKGHLLIPEEKHAVVFSWRCEKEFYRSVDKKDYIFEMLYKRNLQDLNSLEA